MGAKEKDVDDVLENENIENAEQDNAEATETTDEKADSKDEVVDEKAELEKKANDYLDRYQRTLAEFDNFRKRTMKEKASMYDDGVRDSVLKLIPVVHNFERAVSAVSEE